MRMRLCAISHQSSEQRKFYNAKTFVCLNEHIQMQTEGPISK